jgi:Bacterial transcriptional activator domain
MSRLGRYLRASAPIGWWADETCVRNQRGSAAAVSAAYRGYGKAGVSVRDQGALVAPQTRISALGPESGRAPDRASPRRALLTDLAWGRSVLDAPDGAGGEPAGVSDLGDAIFGDLLPDWYDDSLVVERERLRELRVRALERVCEPFTALRSFGPAIEAGLAAVHSEPLRESAHRSLIGVYLAEGNQAEALRAYRAYRDLLHYELALEPSARMEELIGAACG